MGGESPGDAVVVADDDEGRAGDAGANHIDARATELVLVERSRGRELQVRVVGENGPASARMLAGDHELVAAAVIVRPFQRRLYERQGAEVRQVFRGEIHQHRVAGRHAVADIGHAGATGWRHCSRRLRRVVAGRGTCACVRDRRRIVEWRKTMDVLEEE